METTYLIARKKLSAAGIMGYLAILFILFTVRDAWPQRSLPATEPFDYLTGALQVVGHDWIRISGGSNDLLVSNGNVTYNGYLGETGKKAVMVNGASDDLKLNFVSQSIAGTTVFASFTINVLNTNGLSLSGSYCFILGSGTNNFAARIFIKSYGTGYVLGISKTTSLPSNWSSLLPVLSPHLIVMSYEIKPGSSNDVAGLWIDPAITTNQPPALLTTAAGPDFGGGNAIDGFILRQASGTPNVSIDDISISTNWNDLLKNPVFTSSGFIGAGTFNALKINGIQTILTLSGSISIDGSLFLADATICLNGNVLSYGSGGILKYTGTCSQTTHAAEFPLLNGPKDLAVENPAGVFLDIARALPGTLTIINGSKFYINPLRSLTVSGNTILNGTDCLVIKSDASGTGSFIDNGTIEGTGTMRAERYLTSYGNNNDLCYHLISSPVDGQAIQPGFVENPPDPSCDFYQWNEPGGNWFNSKDGTGNWNGGFEPVFKDGKGYLIAYPSNRIKYFSGTPGTHPSFSPLVVNCSYTEPVSGGGGGWNLLGNPFPSAIDWNLVNREPGIDNALYYYDAGIQNYRYFIQFQSGVAVGNGSGCIPPMQGFMVHANNSGIKSLVFDNSCRVHEELNIYYKNSLPGGYGVKLKVENERYSDEAFVVFTDGATDRFDRAFDAYKLSGNNPRIPQIYSIIPGGIMLAINSLPVKEKTVEVALGFKAGEEGSYQLTMDGTSEFFAGKSIILKDSKTGEIRDLKLNPVYHFTSCITDDPNRFLLQLSPLSGVENTGDPSKIRIRTDHQTVIVSVDKDYSKAILSIFNLMGKELYNDMINPGEARTVPVTFLPGVYLVQIVSDGKEESRKVLVY